MRYFVLFLQLQRSIISLPFQLSPLFVCPSLPLFLSNAMASENHRDDEDNYTFVPTEELATGGWSHLHYYR